MATKKIKITTDILYLLKNLQFDTFEFGETFNTIRTDEAIQEIEGSAELMQKYGALRDELVRLKDQLGHISDKKERYAWGINQWSLWGGTYVLEQISLYIGCYDKAFVNTDVAEGREYPKPLEEYMWGLYDYVVKNMEYLINLLFYFTDKGGLTVGEYRYKDGNWEKLKTSFKDETWKDVWDK